MADRRRWMPTFPLLASAANFSHSDSARINWCPKKHGRSAAEFDYYRFTLTAAAAESPNASSLNEVGCLFDCWRNGDYQLYFTYFTLDRLDVDGEES